MRRVARIAYALFAWLFTAGVLLQVFLAGLVVVARVTDWEGHIGLGHGLGLPLLLMLISMYLGGMPGSVKRQTWILFGVYIFQADFVIFLRDSAPYTSALHPVLALVDFTLGWSLARQSLAGVREDTSAPQSTQVAVDPATN
jgi:hypothetical protein